MIRHRHLMNPRLWVAIGFAFVSSAIFILVLLGFRVTLDRGGRIVSQRVELNKLHQDNGKLEAELAQRTAERDALIVQLQQNGANPVVVKSVVPTTTSKPSAKRNTPSTATPQQSQVPSPQSSPTTTARPTSPTTSPVAPSTTRCVLTVVGVQLCP